MVAPYSKPSLITLIKYNPVFKNSTRPKKEPEKWPCSHIKTQTLEMRKNDFHCEMNLGKRAGATHYYLQTLKGAQWSWERLNFFINQLSSEATTWWPNHTSFDSLIVFYSIQPCKCLKQNNFSSQFSDIHCLLWDARIRRIMHGNTLLWKLSTCTSIVATWKK